MANHYARILKVITPFGFCVTRLYGGNATTVSSVTTTQMWGAKTTLIGGLFSHFPPIVPAEAYTMAH